MYVFEIMAHDLLDCLKPIQFVNKIHQFLKKNRHKYAHNVHLSKTMDLKKKTKHFRFRFFFACYEIPLVRNLEKLQITIEEEGGNLIFKQRNPKNRPAL